LIDTVSFTLANTGQKTKISTTVNNTQTNISS